LIRDAIKTTGNTELAETINNSPARDEDKIQVSPRTLDSLSR